MAEQTKEQELKFYFADKDDEVMGIETHVYPNGNMIKRLKLSNGKSAVIRELKGMDMTEVEKLTDGDTSKVFPAIIAVATKIDGAGIVMEDVLQYKAKDYNRLKIAASALNF
jgi:hypothetical protein